MNRTAEPCPLPKSFGVGPLERCSPHTGTSSGPADAHGVGGDLPTTRGSDGIRRGRLASVGRAGDSPRGPAWWRHPWPGSGAAAWESTTGVPSPLPGPAPSLGAPSGPEPSSPGPESGARGLGSRRGPCLVGLPTHSHAGDARAHARFFPGARVARGGGRRVVSDRLRRHPEEARGGREVRRRDERRREQRDGVRRCAESPARRTTGRAERRGGLTHATNARTHANRRHVRPGTRHRRRHLHVLAQRVVDEHLRLGVPRHRPGRKRPSRHPPRALRREVRAADLQV